MPISFWTPEEDNKLISLHNTHSQLNWTEISRLFIGRNGKQCRERYVNYLDPSLKHGPLTEDEKKIIESNYPTQKIIDIAKSLNRSHNVTKNYVYNHILKRQSKSITNTSLDEYINDSIIITYRSSMIFHRTHTFFNKSDYIYRCIICDLFPDVCIECI